MNKMNKIPKFIKCLYQILNTEDARIIGWVGNGSYFQIYNMTALEQQVLPKYFNHGKFSSFQRQLNNFAFRKWTKTRANVCTFSHDVFIQCPLNMLSELVKKYNNTKSVNMIVAEISPRKRQRECDNASQQQQDDDQVKNKKMCFGTEGTVLDFDLEIEPLSWNNIDISDERTLDWDVVVECVSDVECDFASFDFDSEVESDDEILDALELFVEEQNQMTFGMERDMDMDIEDMDIDVGLSFAVIAGS
jgi:hypothetical protein